MKNIIDQFNEPNMNEGYYGYIYIITNKINGKIYIGKRENNRNYLEDDYIGSGKILGYAKQKYGEDNFDIDLIGWYETKEELNKAERFWIAYYNSQDRSIGYNRTEGGDWGDITQGMTPEEYSEWCRKNSEANRGKKNHFYGKHHTEESKRKIANRYYPKGEDNPLYGIKRSDESRAKQSEAMKQYWKDHPEVRERINELLKGREISEETKSKISESTSGSNNHFYGKHHSKESKAKISESLRRTYAENDHPSKGKKMSDDFKKKISDSLKGKKRPDGIVYHLTCKRCGKKFTYSHNARRYCDDCR